jgi:Uri superfamily endonuclease
MKNNKNTYYIAIAFIVLLLASLACGSSNQGTVITPAAQENVQEESSPAGESTIEEAEDEEPVVEKDTQPAIDVYQVGDLVEIKEHTIRLNSVEYQGSMLVANITIENHGSSDLIVSSMLSFSAKKDDGTKLDQEYFDCGSSGLDGSVLPGDKLRGDICWSGAHPEDGIKIYYEASLFSQGAVVWEATEGVAEDLVADTPSQIEMFQVGDLVEIQDHTIRLNSLDYQGNVLMADFTIENFGDSDVDTSSMLSFTAKKSDGIKLEQEILDCEHSGLDGKILPGDRLRGSICWAGATADDGIRIYYEADLFGEGAIVWEAVEGTAESIELTEAQLKTDVYHVGETVKVQDATVVLNSAEFKGNLLKANFTLENQGSSDLEISSMLSFYARRRDGLPLEQEYFDCGTSLDGSVIPGDKLTGDICWKGTGPEDDVKIYFEPELFSEGAVVWRVD